MTCHSLYADEYGGSQFTGEFFDIWVETIWSSTASILVTTKKANNNKSYWIDIADNECYDFVTANGTFRLTCTALYPNSVVQFQECDGI